MASPANTGARDVVQDGVTAPPPAPVDDTPAAAETPVTSPRVPVADWKHELLAPLLMLAGAEAKREYLEHQLTQAGGMEAAMRSYVNACSTAMLKQMLLTFRTEPTLLWVNFPSAAHLAALVESQRPAQDGQESRRVEMQLAFRTGGSVFQVTRAEFMTELPVEVIGEAALKRLNHAFHTLNRRTHFVAFGTCPLDEQAVAFGVRVWPLELVHEIVRAGERDDEALATLATLPVQSPSTAEKRRLRAKRAKLPGKPQQRARPATQA
jgi:hypothetical protein